MVDRNGAARAETGADSEHRRDETPAEKAGRKLKEVGDKVGCATNVALEHFEEHEDKSARH